MSIIFNKVPVRLQYDVGSPPVAESSSSGNKQKPFHLPKPGMHISTKLDQIC